MDEAMLDAVRRDLVEWGVLDGARGDEITRRFRGAIMRATMELQKEEQAGRRPIGHPLRNAVDRAFAAYPLPPGAIATDAHRAFVTAVEVASLPATVREFLGV